MIRTLVKNQLIVINLTFAVLAASVAFFPLGAVRSSLGFLAILFLPGYTLLQALFPDRASLRIGERLILSFGLSIATVPLIGIVLNYALSGIRFYPVLFSLWAAVLATIPIAFYRQKRLLPENRFSLSLGWRQPAQGLLQKLGVACRSIIASQQLKLFLILALGYWLTFIPHREYPYPLHVDEWFHFAYFRAIQSTGGAAIAAVPFYDFPDLASGTIETRPGDVELAFHVIWAIFQQVTEISWLTIFRYFPGIIFLVTILSVYVLARRKGYGVEAAFLASLIPTNITMLGPSLLVPVAAGLMFVPLSLFLVFNFRTLASYIVVFLFITFLLLMHPPTAVILALILLPFIVLGLRKDRKHSVAIAAVVVIPFLAMSPWILEMASWAAKSLARPAYLPPYLPYLPNPFRLWGYIPTLLFVAGVFLLAIKGERQSYALIFACLILLLHNGIFVAWRLGIQTIYHRIPNYLMLLMSTVGGYGLWRLRNLLIPQNLMVRLRMRPNHLYTLRLVLFSLLIGSILAQTVAIQFRMPFYHMIDGEDYSAFVWIDENVPPRYRKAIVDPWKATAFMALARREVYARIQHAPGQADIRAYQFLQAGSADTDFLRDNGISIVYSLDEVRNSDLIQVRKNVYLLQDVARSFMPKTRQP